MRHTVVRWGIYGIVSATGVVLLPVRGFEGIGPWVGVLLILAAGYWLGATFDYHR